MEYFFQDVEKHASVDGFSGEAFADDLSSTKSFPRETPNLDIIAELKKNQSCIHEWGKINRVTFDSGKEIFAILSSADGFGEPFRLLGPTIDRKLTMDICIWKLYVRAKGKSRALLRMRYFYGKSDLLLLFKAHVRSQIEWCNPAIFHAAPSLLSPLDTIQTSFLAHIGISEKDAFLRFGLAPLQTRRDIGMLGMLWKVAHRKCHPAFLELLPPEENSNSPNIVTRSVARRHGRRLRNFCDGTQLCQFERSIFGMVRVWNFLPADIVELQTVKAFQKKLTRVAKIACSGSAPNWPLIYSTRSSPRFFLFSVRPSSAA